MVKKKPTKKKRTKLGNLWDKNDKTLPIEEVIEEEEIIEGDEISESSKSSPTYTKRYFAALQKENDSCCFKIFADSDDIDGLMKKAEKKVKSKGNNNLGVIIYDREKPLLSYKYNLPAIPQLREERGRMIVINDIATRVLEWVKDGC